MLSFLVSLLAVYGLIIILLQLWSWWKLLHRKGPTLLVYLLVQDAEHSIEGWLRGLLYRFAFSKRDIELAVLDYGSTDRTVDIVRKLEKKDQRVEVFQIHDESDLLDKMSGLEAEVNICVCDMRDKRYMYEILQMIKKVSKM